jgi:hypothetical protein
MSQAIFLTLMALELVETSCTRERSSRLEGSLASLKRAMLSAAP